MNDLTYVYATAALVIGLVASQFFRRAFDPFAPIWMFLVGYFQVYVVQAISYHDWALRVHGEELIEAAGFRSFWALSWFMTVYYSPLGRRIAKLLPGAPAGWSQVTTGVMVPPLILWGLISSGLVLATGGGDGDASGAENLLRQFPIFMVVGGVMLIVSAMHRDPPSPTLRLAGITTTLMYVFIWMLNGKRSHSLIGLLTTVAAYYISKGTKPPKVVLLVTGVLGAVVVSLALGWRGNENYERSVAGFLQYVTEFNADSILVNANLASRGEEETAPEKTSKETEEIGGFYLMMSTVPDKSSYDYGESYRRLYSTYIPRLIWRDKPIYGRDKWVAAWIAGSEFKRDETFTGPAIGVLGAAQLNGGAGGTFIVLAILAAILKTAYEYFRLYAHTAWAQVWWPLTFYNAWLMTVNDDPFIWFYYVYGHTTLPPLAFLWIYNRALYGSAKASA
ncbi:hypothetical protein EP7_001096 [Isosphaeraceae bacterium EP7]